MRTDQPLPGDLVIRCRDGGLGNDLYAVTRWPDAEIIIGGPYQSFSYAVISARRMTADRSVRIWRDHARPGHPELLAQVEKP